MVLSEATFGKRLGVDYSSEQRHVDEDASDHVIFNRDTQLQGWREIVANLPQEYRRDENFVPRTLRELVQSFVGTGLVDFIARVIGSGALTEDDEVTVDTFDKLQQSVDDSTPVGVKNQLRVLRSTYAS